MPYITEQEAQHFEALRNAEREQEEENEIDLSAYNLNTPAGAEAARRAIEEQIPRERQEKWFRRLSEASEEQAEAEDFPEEDDSDADDEEERTAMHAELDEARSIEETRAVLSKHGALDE